MLSHLAGERFSVGDCFHDLARKCPRPCTRQVCFVFAFTLGVSMLCYSTHFKGAQRIYSAVSLGQRSALQIEPDPRRDNASTWSSKAQDRAGSQANIGRSKHSCALLCSACNFDCTSTKTGRLERYRHASGQVKSTPADHEGMPERKLARVRLLENVWLLKRVEGGGRALTAYERAI